MIIIVIVHGLGGACMGYNHRVDSNVRIFATLASDSVQTAFSMNIVGPSSHRMHDIK